MSDITDLIEATQKFSIAKELKISGRIHFYSSGGGLQLEQAECLFILAFKARQDDRQAHLGREQNFSDALSYAYGGARDNYINSVKSTLRAQAHAEYEKSGIDSKAYSLLRHFESKLLGAWRDQRDPLRASAEASEPAFSNRLNLPDNPQSAQLPEPA